MTRQPAPTTPPAATAPLRLGVLGCANIARQFCRDVAASPTVQVVAVASRQADKAADFADTLGIGRWHASYEALLADPEVEAIYLPLPNSLHAEWAVRAAQAGKHVLCEKPLALNLSEAQAMHHAAREHGVILLEAYPYAFQPQHQHLLALLAEGAIGQVRSVQACFGFMLPPAPGNIRLQPDLGGGALLDAGSYALSLIREVMGQAPVRVQADASWAPSGVDISLMATLHYADGRRAQLSCAMDAANHRRATVVGSAGILETEFLNHTAAVPDAVTGFLPSQMRLRRGTANSLAFEDLTDECGSGFRFAAEALARWVVAPDAVALARHAQASLDNAATLEALGRSARFGQVVALQAS
ncbi:Gfo/Idh/MocA family oxidoreductase [Curvibacter sp. HBC28]|uniref:Gfo/Idh/MocA family oxidoreductase n=1 Tax=Curvibacter microcysteis TaxID=3026419 RepID=A0ABT5MF94_9BURK|nr:Gfo/Idh/MocA family oxidoreductase [Curvibacter sp. HBC28]MDD0815253.1 Gfo/Idh/MocA family oxidoreductase [Curvibacter sp. HBC28]